MKISVVIPTYNKFDILFVTLKSYYFLDFPRDEFELIICDDGSDYFDDYKLKIFADRINLRIIHVPHCGRSSARNAGIYHSTGELIVFSDDDSLVSSDFLTFHWNNYLHNSSYVNLGRRKQIYLTNETFSFARDLSLDKFRNSMDKLFSNSRADIYSSQSRDIIFNNVDVSKHWLCCTTGNMSVSRERLVEINGFDEAFRGWGFEDIELGYRLYLHGAKFVYDKSLLNYHMEHPRDRHLIISEMQHNIVHFYSKFSDKELIENFWDYYRGEISLKQFDRLSYKEISEAAKDNYFILFKRNNLPGISNLISSI